MRRTVLPALLLTAITVTAAPLTGDASGTVSAGKVDTAAAAKMITDYRKAHGLPAVKVEARLMKMASSHAQRMAETDQLEHVLPGEGSFPQRISAAGYNAALAAENIGAGYGTLGEAMDGWEHSPPHNANLLSPNVTEIGIALYSTTAGRYHTYWSLELARPAEPLPVGPGGAGGAGSAGLGPFGFFGGN